MNFIKTDEVISLLDEINISDRDKLDQSLIILNRKDSNIKRETIVEKFHSISQWYRLFSKEIVKTDIHKINSLELDKRTIEVVNLLTLCNGIIDTYEGIDFIRKKYLLDYKSDIEPFSFSKTKKANYEHDEFFQMLEYDDFKYFKHIRAIFGQHPSNLNYTIDGNNVRGFSSWTFENKRNIFDYDSDLYVNIYYDANKKPWGYTFHIYYDEIIEFTNSVNIRIIVILKLLKEEIERLVYSQKGEIENWDTMNINERIEKLEELIKLRFFSVENEVHGYLVDLEELEEMLEYTPIEGYEEETLEYKKRIFESLEEIKTNVENCTNNELILTNRFMDNIFDAIGSHWHREKFCMYQLGSYRYFDVYNNVIKKALEVLNLQVSNNPNPYYLLFLLFKNGKTCYELIES